MWTATFRKRVAHVEGRFQSTRPVWTATSIVRSGRDAAARFQSTRPVWTATLRESLLNAGLSLFQSTRPVWTATFRWYSSLQCTLRFNPRGPCGPRHDCHLFTIHDLLGFNPRGPCGPRLVRYATAPSTQGVSIHAARVDRDFVDIGINNRIVVSIHAARVDRDANGPSQGCSVITVSIHAARVDRDRLVLAPDLA